MLRKAASEEEEDPETEHRIWNFIFSSKLKLECKCKFNFKSKIDDMSAPAWPLAKSLPNPACCPSEAPPCPPVPPSPKSAKDTFRLVVQDKDVI